MDEIPSHARSPGANRVKSKAPAKVQITAEQLLREAWERKDGAVPIPKQHIADHEELLDYQRNERKQYEMRIVRNRSHTPLWIRYAKWEEEQAEFVRARSIWERAIDNDYRNPVIWLNYAEMEMRHRFVNHARNIFDRAVSLLPRVDQIWLKYAHMEEMLGQMNLSRLVYQRWMKWFPGISAYFAFIRFELRHAQSNNARLVYRQLITVHPTPHSYIKFAKFEERYGELARARHVYEAATEQLSEAHLSPNFFLSFAKFEERRKEAERARVIYKYATTKFSDSEAPDLHRAFTNFEKHQGDRQALDDLLSSKKVNTYESSLVANPTDYDTWFDLLQLMESCASDSRIREAYERAISNPPPVVSKPAWSRYVYLWVSYAIWEELSSSDPPAAIRIYKRCMNAIPKHHRKFSFGKLWLQYAQAEIRNKNTLAARKIFGTGIGVLPHKHMLYEKYIELEITLGEFDRARKIYEIWLTKNPTHELAFLSLADLELKLGEATRARMVLEIATSVSQLQSSSKIWAKLTDILELQEETVAVRCFEGYVDSKSGVSMWMAYIDMMEKLQAADEAIRRLFDRSVHSLREEAIAAKEDKYHIRKQVLIMAEKWVSWESGRSEDVSDRNENIAQARKALPKSIKRKQKTKDGEIEYWEIVFHDEEVSVKGIGGKLMEAARRWKHEQSNG